jgi:formylmethanofuran dehydrogenase subunit C
MRGGTITVDGNAGHEVGANLRRGLIAVQGNLGDFAGISMIAGSIFVGGSLGKHPGAGMKRGTILTLRPVPELPPTFRFDCEYQPTFLRLYFRHLRSIGFSLPESLSQSCFRRYSGDLLALGKGEILERLE